MSKYAIGIDYGTLSVRALLVDIETGKEVVASTAEYPHGVMGAEIIFRQEKASGRMGVTGSTRLFGRVTCYSKRCCFKK